MILAGHPKADAALTRSWGENNIGKDGVARMDTFMRDHQIVRPGISMLEHGNYRLQLDIDGVANAWGLFEKMLLGSCILKVDTVNEQWFYRDMRPWEHFVPVRGDLGDLTAKLDWCLSRDAEAEAIGLEGQKLALQHTFPSAARLTADAIRSRMRPGMA